jgi:hypothetical protein
MHDKKCKFDRGTRKGENAILVEHNAMIGAVFHGEPMRFDCARPVRTFKIEYPTRYPQSVGIWFKPPRRHDWFRYEVLPDNLIYYTIETEIGYVLYDSRDDVPCDMEVFSATKERSAQEWIEKGYEVAGAES